MVIRNKEKSIKGTFYKDSISTTVRFRLDALIDQADSYYVYESIDNKPIFIPKGTVIIVPENKSTEFESKNKNVKTKTEYVSDLLKEAE